MPINKSAKLVPNVLDKKKLEMLPTRDGYGKGVVEAGRKDKNVVVLCADLAESTRSHWFQQEFPDRYVEMGVAEQNMASLAAGMALGGKIPFIASYAVFSPGRNNEQIRTLISLQETNVKIMGAHAGISVGPDGATHQALEDMALMRVQPNMTVFAPCDVWEAKRIVETIAKLDGPAYMRFAREKTPVVTTDKTPFKIGQARVFWESKGKIVDVTIVACGPLVHESLLAAARLEKSGLGVEVYNSPSVKPLDEKTILAAAKKAGAVVTAEEHQVAGGLGGAVAEFLGENYPVPVVRVGVKDRFGESGDPDELMVKFGLVAKDIVAAAKKAIGLKKSK
ncbi:transketolase family protein [Candidatus Saccharibacteria bacterium]|nr:transketolase family protein [Candidatus Saccharibacteria bacterium]